MHHHSLASTRPVSRRPSLTRVVLVALVVGGCGSSSSADAPEQEIEPRPRTDSGPEVRPTDEADSGPNLGDGPDAGPVLPTIHRAKLATYASSACRLTSEGNVRCASASTAAADVAGITDAVALAGGQQNVCALLGSGAVKCWGVGFLGDGTKHATSTSVPVAVTNVAGADAITAGQDNHCARVTGGNWVCWGANDKGQLGDGTVVDRAEPVAVPITSDAVAVVHGASHGCYAIASGTVRCTGLNDRGQLGDGTQSDRSAYADVKGTLGPVVGLDASRCTTCFVGPEFSGRTTCAVLASGALKCWGQNLYNMLGDGSGAAKSVPVDATVVSGVKEVVVGGLSSCARDGTGKVSCWGGTTYVGAIGASEGVAAVTLPSGAEELATTRTFTCARMTSGGVKCWGGPGGPQGNVMPLIARDVAGSDRWAPRSPALGGSLRLAQWSPCSPVRMSR